MANARVLSLETELVRLQEELSATSSDFSNLVIASSASEATLKESLAKAQEELDTARAECECARLSLQSNQTRIETLEARVAELSNQIDTGECLFNTVQNELDVALKNVEELTTRVQSQSVEIDHLKGEVARLASEAQDKETDLVAAKSELTAELARSHVEAARTLAEVRSEAARELAKANKRVAQLEEEAVQARARNRLEGARDFRASAVFRNLAVRLAYPMASQLWDNSIGQTSYLGGFKEDFDPNLLLDVEKDAQFREYVDEGGLEFESSDEFASLQYDEDADANMIPLGIPDGLPKPPQYPPPKP